MAVINTHNSLFCYNRLPFGAASAPASFQRHLETVIAGLPAVQVYLGDVFVAEREDGKESVLQDFLRFFQKHGVKQKADKCHFRKDAIVQLGRRIDKDGLTHFRRTWLQYAIHPGPQM